MYLLLRHFDVIVTPSIPLLFFCFPLPFLILVLGNPGSHIGWASCSRSLSIANVYQEGKRYRFGQMGVITSRKSLCDRLVGEVRAACTKGWGQRFGESVGIRASNGHFIRYEVGDSLPPPHMDIKATEWGCQVANVIIYLSGPKDDLRGGETLLGLCNDPPISISPVYGSMLIWRSYLDWGSLDPRALHSAAPVTRGTKYALVLSLTFDLD